MKLRYLVCVGSPHALAQPTPDPTPAAQAVAAADELRGVLHRLAFLAGPGPAPLELRDWSHLDSLLAEARVITAKAMAAFTDNPARELAQVIQANADDACDVR